MTQIPKTKSVSPSNRESVSTLPLGMQEGGKGCCEAVMLLCLVRKCSNQQAY